MIERSSFNIFARPSTRQPDEPVPAPEPPAAAEPAAPPHPDPLPEGEAAAAAPLVTPAEPPSVFSELLPPQEPSLSQEDAAQQPAGEGGASPPHPDPLPEGEGAKAVPAVRAEAGLLQDLPSSPFPALADQLQLAPQAAITLHVSLPDHPPQPLASTAGSYQPGGHEPLQGDPQTGLAAGTRILTARGEVAVESLQPDDAALGLRGPALLPIAAIGRTAAAKPGVQIAPGALGPDRPRRTLRLAADHPVFLQPEPVPARHLVNGSSIQTVALDGTELFQIDVGASDVLLAEGVPLSSDRRAAP